MCRKQHWAVGYGERTGYWSDKPLPMCAVYQLNDTKPHELLLLTTHYVQTSDLCGELRKQAIPYAMVDPGETQLRIQVVIPIPQPPTPTGVAVERAIAAEMAEPVSAVMEKDWTMTEAEINDLASALWGDDGGQPVAH